MVHVAMSFEISPQLFGDGWRKAHNRAIKMYEYIKKTWPEVDAQLWVKKVTEVAGSYSIITTHESVEANLEWNKAFFNDESDERKQMSEEWSAEAKELKAPLFTPIKRIFYKDVVED